MCQWYAPKAWKAHEDEKVTVVARRGTIIEVDTGKGLLSFDFFGEVGNIYLYVSFKTSVVWFI